MYRLGQENMDQRRLVFAKLNMITFSLNHSLNKSTEVIKELMTKFSDTFSHLGTFGCRVLLVSLSKDQIWPGWGPRLLDILLQAGEELWIPQLSCTLNFLVSWKCLLHHSSSWPP
uniref:Uncharacterized protein n=2 Tax=Lepeophtheirus salmonis TaxID=72036 RepID=A0A0K2U7F0_LEPSM